VKELESVIEEQRNEISRLKEELTSIKFSATNDHCESLTCYCSTFYVVESMIEIP
jgi:hypothetical protein